MTTASDFHPRGTGGNGGIVIKLDPRERTGLSASILNNPHGTHLGEKEKRSEKSVAAFAAGRGRGRHFSLSFFFSGRGGGGG